MRGSLRSLSLCAVLITISVCCAAAAQTEPAAPPPSFYRKVIPVDTGVNGYEEFTLAADLIARHPARERISAADLTLAAPSTSCAEAGTAQVISPETWHMAMLFRHPMRVCAL